MQQTRLSTSHWPADTSEPILDITVGDLLREAAASAPEQPALIAATPDAPSRRRWTYQELLTDAELVARALNARFAPGERVAIWAPNVPEWILLEFGAAMAGVTLVTVNPAFRPGELRYVLRQSRAAGIFLVPEFRSPMSAFLDEVRPELPDLREVILLTEWEDFCGSASWSARLPAVSPDDAAQIQYTSGTTGFPKGALLSHRSITNNARFCAQRLAVVPGEVWANPMPLFHTAGCVLGVLGAVSARAVQLPVLAFDPGLVLDLIETEKANVLVAVPTMLVALLEHPDMSRRDHSSLRAVYSGGAPVPPALVHRAKEVFGVSFTIVFGTTETSPLVTQTRLDDDPRDTAETIGQPLPQTEVKIIDPATGEVAPVGSIGELCVRGYLLMKGYYETPEATAEAIDAGGWYHTGDLASMDDRGYLRIEGRLKEMIIRGGENIYPREIEELLFSHTGVAEVAVVGIPDERWGEVVAAFIRPAPGEAPTEEELFAFCREHLAPFKTPREWVFVDSLPVTPSGKIQKFVLRERLLAARAAGPGQAGTAS